MKLWYFTPLFLLAILAASTVSKPASVRLLSLDGGGMRGVVSLTILARIEDMIKPQPLWQAFHVVGGTSTGGIITACIFTLQKPARDCLALYEDLGRRVFLESTPSKAYNFLMDAITGETGSGARYDHQKLEAVIKEMVGAETTLYDIWETKEKCKTFMVSTNNDADQLHAYLFRNYETKQFSKEIGSTQDEAKRIRLWEAVRATSAAPTFFTPIKILGASYIDGGLMHNNPSLVVYQEARQLELDRGRQLSDFCLVSVGTGQVTWEVAGSSALLALKDQLINRATQTEDVYHSLYVEHPEDVFRLNPNIGKLQLDVTDPKALAILKAKTLTYLASPGGRVAMSHVLRRCFGIRSGGAAHGCEESSGQCQTEGPSLKDEVDVLRQELQALTKRVVGLTNKPFTPFSQEGQILAQALCRGNENQWSWAVGRDVPGDSCSIVCKQLDLTCSRGYHLYPDHPFAALSKKGLMVHTYTPLEGCTAPNGPNYCCCVRNSA